MKHRIPAFAWLLLVAAFAGATACAGSCAGPRPQAPQQQQAPPPQAAP